MQNSIFTLPLIKGHVFFANFKNGLNVAKLSKKKESMLTLRLSYYVLILFHLDTGYCFELGFRETGNFFNGVLRAFRKFAPPCGTRFFPFVLL